MKRMIAAAVTAVFAVSMTTAAFADDVVVRTSIGSGEVVFTETSEAADITSEDLTSLVKDALKDAASLEQFNGFLDAEAAVSLKMDAENEMNITGSVIGNMNRNKEDGYFSLFYSLDGFGNPMSGKYEAYHWVKDDTHYSAVSDGSGWKVETEDFITVALEHLAEAVDSEQADKLSLDALQPNLYEDEDGNKYYVCVYDKDTVMNTAGSVEGFEMYSFLADSILGDNEVQLIVVVNAESGLPRAVSLNASGAAGQIPGEMFGMENALEYGADDLYVTFLMDTYADEIEIPEEVLNTPVSESALDLSLNDIMSSIGMEQADSFDGME